MVNKFYTSPQKNQNYFFNCRVNCKKIVECWIMSFKKNLFFTSQACSLTASGCPVRFGYQLVAGA